MGDRPLKDRVVVLTGCTHGIGAALVPRLAALGASLALVCRDPGRGKAAQERASGILGVGEVDVFVADFKVQADVRRVAGEIAARYPAGIHVLVRPFDPL